MPQHKWNERYARGQQPSQPPLAFIERVAREYPPGYALDLACGLGRHALCLARSGWTVRAVDSSDVAIKRLTAATLAEGLPIQSEVQDLEADDYIIEAEGFDLICVSLYLQRTLIPRIQAGVRHGGIVAIVLPMVDDLPDLKPMNPEFLVQPGELLAWFGEWTIVEYKEERETPNSRKLAKLLARRPERL